MYRVRSTIAAMKSLILAGFRIALLLIIASVSTYILASQIEGPIISVAGKGCWTVLGWSLAGVRGTFAVSAVTVLGRLKSG